MQPRVRALLSAILDLDQGDLNTIRAMLVGRPASSPIDADEVQPGSVVEPLDGDEGLTVRLVNGKGWHCDDSSYVCGWGWDKRGFSRCRVLADDLTEDEALTVAKMDADEARAWCERRGAKS